MKAVLLSIKPKYCELIANGKKTLEVRKTRPKTETPFKCFIYCTFNGGGCVINGKLCGGKVIGEFICDGCLDLHDNGKEFVIPLNRGISVLLMPRSCLSYKELRDYANGKQLYGWHISDLKIYDKPKELSEFRKPGGRQCVSDNGRFCKYIQASPGDDPADANTMSCIYGEQNCPFEHLSRPPQSWGYVEEIE